MDDYNVLLPKTFALLKDIVKNADIRAHDWVAIDRMMKEALIGGTRHQIFSKAKRGDKPPSKMTIYNWGYKDKNPHKVYAHSQVAQAKQRGELAPQPCTDCGTEIGVECHHEDYGRPLEVIWLCRPCHQRLHKAA